MRFKYEGARDRVRTYDLCFWRAELYTTELGQNTFFTSFRESTQELFSDISPYPLPQVTHQPFRGRITFYI